MKQVEIIRNIPLYVEQLFISINPEKYIHPLCCLNIVSALRLKKHMKCSEDNFLTLEMGTHE